MSTLAWVWVSAAFLSGAAILWLTTLIALRFVHERLVERRYRRRVGIERAFVAVLRADAQPHHEPAFHGPAPELAEALLSFLDIVRGKDREAVLNALETSGVDEALRTAATRGRRADRLVCLEALAAFASSATTRVLQATADDPDWQIRLAALNSLTTAGAPPSISRLLDDLTHGQLPYGRSDELVRAVITAEPAAAMRALDRTDLAPPAIARLIEGLGAAGDYQALPHLIAHVEDADEGVRTAAVTALGVMMHPAGAVALERALEDSAWRVRSAAADAIGAGRLTALADKLFQRLADPVWDVRFRAGAALAKLGEAGVARLTKAADEADANVRRAASIALVEVAA